MKRSLNPVLAVVIIVLVLAAVALVGWRTMAGKPGIEQQQDRLKADMQRNMATGAGGGMKGGAGGGGREVGPPPGTDQ